ncbi:Pre-rRNA-processing protein ipi3 [Tilletia horrida]|uniref:Pre-rRNA-processing protein IPI3 n=1 Tax=Tilletia horrida TaxID=155126 RepID=A0AAN6JSN8_9BASI|nr:Pre-rRNA-processing protein ipi3 [Tilletia horrida]KAK0555017.1 Pre-rRNA-processing protein ipi3 [Tilletia horrida]KAK0568391.1 Pre-rRNA-processing protein ipi3 [Tilletia horrida]
MASFVNAGSSGLPALRLLAQEAIVYTRAGDSQSAAISGLLPLSTAAPSGLTASSSALATGSSSSGPATANGGALDAGNAIPPTQPTIAYRQAISPASHAFDINVSANLMAAADIRSPTLLFWSLRSDVLLQRIIVPTRLTTVALSPDGDLCAAGSTEGSLFLWQVSTGQLLALFDAHYRAVTVLKWCPDGQALVSAGADSRILVWSLAGLLAPEAQHQHQQFGGVGSGALGSSSSHQPHPYATLSDHTLPVTSLAFPPTARFPAPATLWSTSLDGSVKLWDLRTRSLLYTYALPFPLQHLACDSLNRFLYVSTAPANAASASASTSTAAPNELARVIRIDVCRQRVSSGTEYIAQEEGEATEVGNSSDGQIIRLRHRITSLALSPTSSHLLVGTAISQLHVFDANTAQTLSVLNLGPSIINSASSSASSSSNSASASGLSLKNSGKSTELGGGPGTCFGPGAITNLRIAVLPPVQSRMSAAMGSMSAHAGGAKNRGGEEDATPLVASNFGRTVSTARQGSGMGTDSSVAEAGEVVWRRIPRDLDKISSYICASGSLFPSNASNSRTPSGSRIDLPLPGLFPQPAPTSVSLDASAAPQRPAVASSNGHPGDTISLDTSEKEDELGAEIIKLRAQLAEATRLNERLYALVEGGAAGTA